MINFLQFQKKAFCSIVLTLIVGFSFYTANAQLSSKYTFGTGSNMTSLNGAGTSVGSLGTVVTGVPIGFTFTFNCINYTTLGASSNGFIWFGSGTCSASQTTPLSSQAGESGAVDAVIAIYGGSVTTLTHWTYQTSGTAPNRVFKIEWYGIKIGSEQSIVQMILNENGGTNSNRVELHYNDAQYSVASAANMQIGMRDNTLTNFLNRKGGSGWTTGLVAGTLNTDAATISSSGYPNNGSNFQWVYNGTSCCTPPGTNATAFSATSVNTGAGTATVSFTRGATGSGGASAGVIVIGADGAYPSAPTNGTVYSGPSTAWGSGTAVGGGFLVYASTTAGDGVTSIPINLTGLTSGHSYYFSVFEYSTTGSSACYESTPLQGGFCIGPPSAATITSSINPVCPSSSATLSLSGLHASLSYTYNWQYGATSGSESGSVGTSSTYATPAPLTTTPSYYVCAITCPTTGNVTTATEFSETQNSFLNCYCTYGSFTAPSAADEVTNVTLAGNSVTLNNTPPLATYTLYTSQVPDLSQGSSYTLKVTDGTSTRRNNYAAWIDWDQNGVFGNNANEYLGVFTGVANGVQESFAITVPLTSVQGTTAMRVVYDNQNGTTGFSNSAPNCTFSASPGEMLDFHVTVSGCAGPSTQASAFVTDPSPTTTSCNVQFTRGNGTGGILVVCKAGSAPTGPVPGTAYNSANANITAGGSTTAAGSFVIYNSNAVANGASTGNIPATNLTPGTTYYFAAYEWNSSATCYSLTSPPGGTVAIPLCIQPTTQVSGFSAGSPSTTSATLSWTAGNGDHTIILLKQGSAVNGAPALTTAYTDNLNYNYGSPSGTQIGTGNYVMFGDGGTANATNATITGLLPSTTYYYAAYTYFSATHCYYLTSPVTGSFTTASCSPSTNASGLVFSNITNNALTATWTRGSGSDVLVVARLTATAQVKPVYNTTYTTNTAFGSGTGTSITGTGNYVVYNGTGTTVNITAMGNASAYTLDLYEYNATPNCYTTSSYSLAQTTLDATTSGGCSASVARTQTAQSSSPHNDASYTAIAPAVVIDNSGSTTGYYQGGAINTPGSGLPIGFNFVYNGTTYTTFGLGVNGYIWFGSGVPSPTATNPISNASANLGGSGTISGVISANGILLYTGNSNSGQSIGYTLSGTAPNRVLKIQWKGYAISGSYSLCNSLSYTDANRHDFQIILNEDGGTLSDQITLAYADMNPYCAYYSSASAQVGIRGADNTTFTNRTGANSNWANTAGGSNSATCTITGNSYVGGNVAVTFTQASTVGPTVSVGSLTCPAGTKTLTASSGFPSYQWFNGANVVAGPGSSSSTLTATTSGTYSVVGKNGSCYLQSSATPVTVGSCCTTPVVSSNTPVNPTVCGGGGTNGSIALNGLAASTTFSVTYNYNGSPISAANYTSDINGILTIPNLSAGSYNNFVLSVSVCTSSAYPSSGSITLTDPVTPSLPSGLSNQSVCGNGNVTFSVADPTTGYTIQWSTDGSTNNDGTGAGGSGLVSVIHAVTVGSPINEYARTANNASGCTSAWTSAATGTANSIPSITSNTPTGTSTCGGSDGSILLNGLSNNTVYSVNYNLNGSPVGAANFTSSNTGVITISGLSAGSYDNFILSGPNGCVSVAYPSSGTIVLSDPTAPSISSNTQTNPSTCSGSDGNIGLLGLNASTSYLVSYNQNGTPVTPSNISTDLSGTLTIPNLVGGVYDNIVVSLSGCTSNTYPSSGSITLLGGTPVIGSNTPTNPSTCSGTDGSIALNGLVVRATYLVSYKRNGSPVSAGSISADAFGVVTIPNLSAGSYTNIVVTLSGCPSNAYPSSGSITLSDPPSPVISGDIANNPTTCTPGNDGSIALNGLTDGITYAITYKKGGVGQGPVNLTASGGLLTISNLTAGVYNNFVAVVNGCSSSAFPSSGSVTLSNPPTPAVSSNTPVGPSTCSGSEGSIALNGLTNGTSYSVTYNLGGVGQGPVSITAAGGAVTINGLSAGNYDHFVLTNSGCSSTNYPSSGTITLSDPAKPSAPVSGGNVNVCSSNVPGILSATATSGNTIDWYDAAAGGTLLASGSNTYAAYYSANFYAQARNTTTGCTSSSRTKVTSNVVQIPIAYNVSGGACTPANIGLNNSQTGVSYQLVRDGSVNVGSPIAGTTNSPINFGVYNVTGTYSVVATTTVGGCTADMTGVSTVGLCISTWAGGTSNDWFDQTNWFPEAVPNICGSTIRFSSSPQNMPVIRGADVQVGNVQIPAGASITVYNGQTLSICGDWTAASTTNPSFLLGGGNVEFNGGFQQTITGLTEANIVNLNNTFGAAFASGAVLDVSTGLQLQSGTLDVSQGTLHLMSGGYIDDFTSGFTGNLNGSIIADRAIPVAGSNQHFVSSPVNAPALSQIGAWGPDGSYVVPSYNCDETVSAYGSPYGSVFVYNDGHMPPTGCMLGNWEIKSAGNMLNGLGYSAYLQGNSTISLSGVANTGNLTIGNLNNSGYPTVNTAQGSPIQSGWNLVGNPYPSALDLIADRTGSGFGNQVQVWQTSGPFAGSWQPLLISGNPGDVVIPPFQGFMVRRVGANTGSYPFNQIERSRASTQSFYRTKSTNSLQLSVDYNGVKDMTTVAFNPQATDSYDAAFDADKPDGNGGRPTLYSYMDANEWYAVNTLPLLTQTTVVPVGLRPEATGTMTISASGIETFDPTTYIYLEDKLTGAMSNLRNGAYTFTTNASDNRDRFALHFTPPAQILTTDATCEASGMINIVQPGGASWNYNVADAGNSTISSGSLSASIPVTVNAEPGIYTLTLSDNSGYTVVKTIQVGGEEIVSAAFNSSANTAPVQQNITFTGNTADASSYNWNFGDGASATGQTAVHSFKQEGIYNVELSVNSPAGCSSSATRSIVITSRSVTSVSNLNNAADIGIWSSENRVFVDFSKQTNVNAEIDMYNVLGQLIDHETFGRSTLYSHEITNLEVAYLIVKVVNNDQVTTKKVFIANAK